MKGTMRCQNRGSGSGTCEEEEVRVGHVKIEEVGNRAYESRNLEWDIWKERKRERDMNCKRKKIKSRTWERRGGMRRTCE